MNELANKLRKRGPDGQLTEETPEEIQSLSGKIGLQAPPITPLGAAAIGANPDQQKMMGAPNQKQAALTLAATPPSSSLQDALRRAQPRNEATTQEAGSMKKSQDLQNLGSLGDRVGDFINTQRAKLAPPPTGYAGVDVKSVDQFQGKDISNIKDLLGQFRKNPNSQTLLLQINEALGYDVNTQLNPQQVDQLYEDATTAIAKGGAGVVDDDLNVDDLTAMPNFGYSANDLSNLLGIPAADIGKYTVGQLRSAVNAATDNEFSKTQDLEQKASSGQLGIAERGLARQGARESSRVGTRASEADMAHLEQQIQNADQVQFGGKSYNVDTLLKDSTISGIINDYMNAAPGSELRKQLETTEPALIQFIQKNQAVLKDASTAMQAGATEFNDIQATNKGLQTIGGVKLDNSIASALIPGFGKLQTSRIDTSKVPLLQHANSIGPEASRALIDQVNGQVARDPSFAGQLSALNANDLKNLGIENNGTNWQNYIKQQDQFNTFQSLDPKNVDQLVSNMVAGVSGAGDAQAKLSQNYAQGLVFGGVPTKSILDLNGDGKIDDGASLKQRLVDAVPKPDLKDAAAGKSSIYTKQEILPATSMNPIQSSILKKLGDITGASNVNADMIRKAGLNLDELVELRYNKSGSALDHDEIDREHYWAAANNTKDLIDSTERSGRSRPDQITELQNQLKQQGDRRLDTDRVNARIKQLATDELAGQPPGADSPEGRAATRQRLRQQKQLISLAFPPFATLSSADQDALMDIGGSAGSAFIDQLKKVDWSSGRTIPENLGILTRDLLTSVPRAELGAISGALDTLSGHVSGAAGDVLRSASNTGRQIVQSNAEAAAREAVKTAKAIPKAQIQAVPTAVQSVANGIEQGGKSLSKKLKAGK